MANLDTPRKRISSARVLQPYNLCEPIPDTVISGTDRAHISWVYNGFVGRIFKRVWGWF